MKNKNKYKFLLYETFQNYSENNISTLAAALAYYTAFSIAPLLIICMAVSGIVFGNHVTQTHFIKQLIEIIGSEGAQQIQIMIVSVSKPNTSIITTIIGFIILLAGTSGMFFQLQDGLNKIWGVAAKPGSMLLTFLKNRILPFILVFFISVLLLASLIISTLLMTISQYFQQYFGDIFIFWKMVDFVFSLMIVTFLFAMIFKILPDITIKWVDVLFGSFITALLFTAGKFLLTIYFSKVHIGSTFGAAGSIIIILAWVYYFAQILFIGAAFTKSYSKT